jgi:hypothetical protein
MMLKETSESNFLSKLKEHSGWPKGGISESAIGGIAAVTKLRTTVGHPFSLLAR